VTDAIICDIDGTIAEKGDRSPYDYAKVGNDTAKPATVQLLKDLKKNKYQIILMSGREDSCRDETIQWLKKHKIPWDFLYMRETGDGRGDQIVKKEMYDTYVKDIFRVLFVLDDRDKVVKMWRTKLNLPCFQVEYGDF